MVNQTTGKRCDDNISNGKILRFYSLFGVLGMLKGEGGGVGHSARHWSGVNWDS
jgi:hypothetical protein